MEKVYNWYIKYSETRGFQIKGVFDVNGSSVLGKTDTITEAVFDKDNSCIVATTANGECCSLSSDEIYIGRQCYPPQDWVDDLHRARDEALRMFCNAFKMPEVCRLMLDAKAAAIAKQQRRIEEIKHTLPENTLYLDLRDYGYYFNFAVCNIGGEISNCDMYYHSSWTRDSVLVEKDGLQCLVRFFPMEKNSVEFYNSLYEMMDEKSPEGTLLGYLHNSGHAPLFVEFSWGKSCVLAPDQEIEVHYGMGSDEPIPLVKERREAARALAAKMNIQAIEDNDSSDSSDNSDGFDDGVNSNQGTDLLQ